MNPQPQATPRRVVTVEYLADYLRRNFEANKHLRDVSVRGEISGLSRQPNGNVYFVLKDRGALLNCVSFPTETIRMPAHLENGQAVVATGSVVTYPMRSTYQLRVRVVDIEGLGDLHAIFEERKRALAAEGLFAAERKRDLPSYPFRVGLVSSRTSDGAIDFVRLLSTRAPHVAIVWFETSVQGQRAPDDIVRAIERASRADLDCVVLTRGGGSFEDLFCFSDERVVRAVAACAHPIVSAIGHTADQQLCDAAADRHVETPSAAAKTIGFATADLLGDVREEERRAGRALALQFERLSGRLARALLRSRVADGGTLLALRVQRVDEASTALAMRADLALRRRATSVRDLERRLQSYDPRMRLAGRERRLHAATVRLDVAATVRLANARARFLAAQQRLEPAVRAAASRVSQRFALANAQLAGNDPEAILQRGYAIVTHRGAIVRDPGALAAGEAIEARVAHGTIFARVEPEKTDGN